MATIKEAMDGCEVLQKASPASLAALFPRAALKSLSRGEHLFWDKDRLNNLYFVAEGQFAIYKQNSLGEKKVIFVCGPGQMLNEAMPLDLPASISCEAFSITAQALYFPGQDFIQAMESDFGLAGAVMEAMAVKIRRLYRQLKNTAGSIRGDRRIAAKFWKLSRDHGVPHEGGIRIDLDLTITYFADMLGARRETVSRQIKLLTDVGLVLQTPAGFIIPDRDKLKKYFDPS